MIVGQSTSKHYDTLVGVLGKSHLHQEVRNPFDFINLASQGIDAEVISNFRNYFDLTLEETAQLLNVSEPTLYRWLRSDKKLERNFSVKLFEITDLFLLGIEVFESKENFFKWLELPNTALGGLQPIELAEIPGGMYKIRQILGRIEHGLFS